MNSHHLRTKTAWVLVCLLGIPSAVTAQVVKIVYPESRAVFQRENDNTSTIHLSGNYFQPTDSVQARVRAEVVGQGFDTDWTTIQRNVQGGVFQGAIRGRGGWYRLEVRAFWKGSIIGTDEVRKVGIGEVFIITGQSNAQGFQNFGAPAATDDRVNCVTYNNTTANSLNDPPAPTFQQLSANALIGPRGQSAWCWGVLGDLIAKQYQVPVLFINTAWQATGIQNWRESAEGKITKNIFALGTPDENFPVGMPYANLVIALRYYCSLQGLRAVLWQQGENDNVPLNSSRQAYRDGMQFIVNKTRSDTERYPAWVLARSSYNAGKVSESIIQAQNDVINTFNNNVFAGPFTDNIQVPRYEGEVHFGGEGLRQLGQAWFESLNSVFFSSSRPLPPLPQPVAAVACAGSNNALTITLPNLYSSYAWNTGQTSQSISVTRSGTYRAILKDRYGNTYISPTVNVTGAIQPNVPTFSLPGQEGKPAGNQLQICADSSLTLVANVDPNSTAIWSTNIVNKNVVLQKAGNYTVRAVNVYGCQSAPSAPISLTVRPRVPTPSVEQVGTYTLQAVLPTSTGAQIERFDWRRAGEVLPQSTPTIKVIVSAAYSARTQATFALGSGTNLTCFSEFSSPRAFKFSLTDGGLSVYPNPSTNGQVTIETFEDLKNADIRVFTLTGNQVFVTQVPLLDERKAVELTGLAPGMYIVRVRSAGFDVSRRVIIN